MSISAFIIVDHSRPEEYISHYPLDMVLLLGLYLAFPIPLKQRVIAALSFSIVSVILLFVVKEPTHDFARGSISSSFVIANVIGFLAARWNGISRRTTFGHIENDHAVSIRLAEAVRIARDLSLLLPICSVCKKVRRDDGYWQQIDVFLRDHSPAYFSHSMCSDCMKEWYPDLESDE